MDDETAFLKMTGMMLADLEHYVLVAATPGEAVRLAKNHSGKIHLIVTDVVMPEMSGRDLAENFLSHDPDIKSLFMSGYTADAIAHRGVLNEEVYFIQKPLSITKLAMKVQEVLE